MKKLFILALALVSAATALQAEDKVLLTIDGEPVMQSEFLYIYNKNNQETAIDQKSIDEYMDLFVNFKLKVKEAEAQGIDTTEAFKKELASYRKQATPKYMCDSTLEEQMMLLSYDHMSRDRRVSHIAIECPMQADSAAVAEALAKINDARVRVTTGKPVEVKKGKKIIVKPGTPEDFAKVALEVSTDPSVQENSGELGWIMPFRYVWPFEKAVFNTEVGQVSEVFRTGYGFHIALVEEERAHEEVKAAHIMKMVPRGNDSLSMVAKATLTGLHQLIVDGADFAEIAKQHSDDKGSAMRGGDLGWFGRGMMVRPFEDAAFSMKPGELSKPFESRFGWHFIKLESRRSILPYDSIKNDIRQKMKRDERYQDVERAYIEKLRAEYHLPAGMSDAEVKQVEDDHLEAKHPELKSLVKEYHDGILLFDVSLKEVWDKASLDTAGITAFFQQHKKEYTWDAPKYKGFVVSCKDKGSMKAVKAILKNAHKDSIESYIKQRINIDSTLYVRVERGLWEQGKNPIVDKLQWKKGDWAPTEEYPYVFLSGKVLKAPAEYIDERGKVTSAYQDYLEKQWIEQLRKKYTVVINQDALEELKK